MKDIIRLLHSVFFWTYGLTVFLLQFFVSLPLALFQKNRSEFLHHFSQIWFKYFILPFTGIKVEVSGLKNIPKKKAVIFASNHQSLADIPLLLVSLPGKYHFVAKKELFRIPLVGWYIGWAGHIRIDRSDSISAIKTLDKVIASLEAGESIVIFPEGTRSRTGKLGEFKRGSLLIAFKTGVPVIPVAISGSFDFMPKWTFLINPAKVKIQVGEPISFAKKDKPTREEQITASNKVREAILSMQG